ncbi:MAG: arylsulfatase [Blastocatellia bacterium]
MQRISVVCLLLSSVLLINGGRTSNAQSDARPNVIIILSDDQGYGDFSAHGNPVLKTPNLDRLHSQSVRLTDFHVAPMCTPTRGQLLTGVDALRNGATSVTAGRSLLRPGFPAMAEIFKSSGYRTAVFGKWHLGDSWPNLPHLKGGGGFEEAVYHLGWGVASLAATWENDNFDDRFFHNGVLKEYKGYCTDIWFDLAMNWMKARKERKEPFFLYLPTNAPHGPLWVADKYKKPYEGKGPAAFFGMIANLDENVGRLDAFLRENGLADDTIVIFMNDNGGTAGVRTFNAGMRAQKTQVYDGGHRAACFIRWPNGGLRKPGDVDALTQVQDLLPTLIEFCELKRPKTAKFDGASLAALLRGKAENLGDRMLVVQYGQTPAKYDAAVMWNKWRLVKGKELYDIARDPGQQTDLASEHPDIARKMVAHYDRWWAGVEPNLKDFVPVALGAPQENPVTLTAVDWADVYCDNVNNCLRPGENKNGVWHVRIARGGNYQFELRRWPKEADAAITAGVPEFKATDGSLPAGRALPVAKARIKIGAFDQTVAVTAQDKAVTFSVPLQATSKTQLQTWFYDAQGNQLCGAYFVYAKRQ